MPLYKAILFDNDGTLVDTHDLLLDSFQYATRTVLGVTLPDDVLMEGVGTPLAQQMKGFTDDPALQEELLRVYREYNHARHDSAIALFPGVLETVQTLHEQGIKMGVVTAKLHELAWRGIELMGLAPYMDCLVGPDDCPKSKPDPAPVLMGCELLGVSPGECLYVGDSPYDMRAGREAGCATAAALWGMFEREVLEPQQPTYWANSFDELLEIAG